MKFMWITIHYNKANNIKNKDAAELCVFAPKVSCYSQHTIQPTISNVCKNCFSFMINEDVKLATTKQNDFTVT
jgi:hypothetical protein